MEEDFFSLEQMHSNEWIQSNALGSYSFGCVDRVPRRKYHSLLMARNPGGSDPINTLLDLGEFIKLGETVYRLHSFEFETRRDPKGFFYLKSFQYFPNPTWVYELPKSAEHPEHKYIQIKRVFKMLPNRNQIEIQYEFLNVRSPLEFSIRPFFLFRNWHSLTECNPVLDGSIKQNINHNHNQNNSLEYIFQPYAVHPPFHMKLEGVQSHFQQKGGWVERIFYSDEKKRGYAHLEDAYFPGQFRVRIEKDEVLYWMGGLGPLQSESRPTSQSSSSNFGVPPLRPPLAIKNLKPKEKSNSKEVVNSKTKLKTIKEQHSEELGFEAEIGKSLNQFYLSRGDHENQTVSMIAGFPWSGLSAREALLSLPGWIMQNQNNDVRAYSLLLNMAPALIQGMREGKLFPHSFYLAQNEWSILGVETPLLFVRAVQLLLNDKKNKKYSTHLLPFVYEILESFRSRADGRLNLIEGGLYVEHGPWSSSWMDEIWDHKPLTPRTGFAVELNALFYNALEFSLHWAQQSNKEFYSSWISFAEEMKGRFYERFWRSDKRYFADVVADVFAHRNENSNAGIDDRLRPNQLWVFALPYSPLPQPILKEIGSLVLEEVRKELVTDVGLRSLGPNCPDYRGSLQGNMHQLHHQGGVWPWFIGIYSDALENVFGFKEMSKQVEPILLKLIEHFEFEGCFGHISETFDGSFPHRPGGLPAYSVSLSEVFRVYRKLESRDESAKGKIKGIEKEIRGKS